MTEEIRVLHVDDEPDFVEMAAHFIERQKGRMTVDTASGVAEALDRIGANDYDCIVSDYDMPGKTGVDFLEIIRADNDELPFILFTGKGSEEIASEAISAGVTDYLQKEAGTSQYAILVNRIENAVGSYRRDQERQQFELAVQQTGHAVYITDIEGTITYVNPAFERITGYTQEQAIGRTPRILKSGEMDDAYHDELWQTILSGEVWDEEIINQRRNGEFYTATQTIAPILRDSQVTGFVGVQADITERKTKERMLEEIVKQTPTIIQSSTRKEIAEAAVDIVRTVLDSPLAGVHLLADNGNKLDAIALMDEARQELGVTPTYDRDDDDRITQIVWETFENGESRYIEDTDEIEELGRETPARSAIVQPLPGHGVLIISKTEPAAFDQAARMYAELLAHILTAALDGVSRQSILQDQRHRLERLHQAAGAIHKANSHEEIAELVVKAAEDILGFPLVAVRYYRKKAGGLVPIAVSDTTKDLLGPLDVYGPEDGSLNWVAYKTGTTGMYGNLSEVEDALDSDTPIESLMHFPLGQYGTISVSDIRTHSFDETDRFHGELLAKTAEHALSELDREIELLDQRDELNRQNERLDEFASMISHDLRNPISIAQGNLELLDEGYDGERLKSLKTAINRIDELVTDLTVLARQGTAEFEPELVALDEIAREEWEMTGTLSATLETETAQITGDRSQLKGLFDNLFRNAVGHGGSDVTVRVGPIDDGFYVEDTGNGIPEEIRDEVFEHGFSTGYGGSGVGLTIVGHIAQAHGFDVSLTESEEGGARFEFTNTSSEVA